MKLAVAGQVRLNTVWFHLAWLAAVLLLLVLPAQAKLAAEESSWAQHNEEGIRLHRQGRYSEARAAHTSALAELDRMQQRGWLRGLTLNNLGLAATAEGDYPAAERYLKEALDIWIAPAPSVQANRGALLNNLGALYDRMGNLAAAEDYHRQALALRQRLLGPDHPDVAESFNNLGEVLRTRGEHAEAEDAYRSAVEIWTKAGGPDNPSLAAALNNLGSLQRETNRLDESEKSYRHALAIREKSLGPQHPLVGHVLFNLGGLLKATGRLEEAGLVYGRVLSIREKAHSDSGVMAALSALADLRWRQGRAEEAEALLKKAVAIGDLPSPTPAVTGELVDSLDRLSGLYHDLGRDAETKLVCRRLLTLLRRVHGSEHARVGRVLAQLGGIYSRQGLFEEAESHFLDASAVLEKAFGPDHPDVATALNNLAAAYFAQKNYREAELVLGRAIRIFDRLGEPHPSFVAALANYALLLRQNRRNEAAERIEQRLDTMQTSVKSLRPGSER